MMRNVPVAFLAAVLLGCRYDPHAQLLTTTEPKTEDLVGVYVLDRFDLPADLTVSNLIVEVDLHADGTFTATNVPPWTLPAPDKNLAASLITATGTWKKRAIGSLDPGHRSIWGFQCQTPDNQNIAAEFTGQKPSYGVIFELGDPDSGYAIVLRRKQ